MFEWRDTRHIGLRCSISYCARKTFVMARWVEECCNICCFGGVIKVEGIPLALSWGVSFVVVGMNAYSTLFGCLVREQPGCTSLSDHPYVPTRSCCFFIRSDSFNFYCCLTFLFIIPYFITTQRFFLTFSWQQLCALPETINQSIFYTARACILPFFPSCRRRNQDTIPSSLNH